MSISGLLHSIKYYMRYPRDFFDRKTDEKYFGSGPTRIIELLEAEELLNERKTLCALYTYINTNMTNDEAEAVTNEKILEEPIEILVNLARNGEIDPWNIDIVEITDKFLRQVEELEKMDLRVSGRTLLYAAILLRMKSNALVEVEEIPEDFMDEGDNFEISDYPVPTLPLRRRSRRPVTLNELLTELKKAEALEDKRLERIRNKKEVHRTTIKEVLSIAHEEDIESRVAKMRNILTGLFEKQKNIQFSELAGSLDRAGRIMAYLALLFLATKKEIWLEQEELFGELFIRRQEAS